MKRAVDFPPSFRAFAAAAEIACCLTNIWLFARAGLRGRAFIPGEAYFAGRIGGKVAMGRCTYCEREEMANGYLQPPMCARHHVVAVIASMLRSRGQPPSVESIKRLLEVYPQGGITVDQVDELARPMGIG